MPYRIAGWSKDQGSEHPYEPPNREVSGDGPLKWVRSYVWGHALSDAYRTLLEADPLRGLAAFGAFHKLLEIAADEPRHRRDGTLYRHQKPASDKDLAFLLGLPVMVAEPLIQMLVEVGWLLQVADAVEQTTEPVKETTDAVEPATPVVKTLTDGAKKRRTELELDVEGEREDTHIPRASEASECPFDTTDENPPNNEVLVSDCTLVPVDMMPDLANLFGIQAVDSTRLGRVGRIIRVHGEEAARHGINVAASKERRRWSGEQTLKWIERCASSYVPESSIKPSPRVTKALEEQEAEKLRRRKRAESVAAQRGLIKTTPNELEKHAEVTF